MNIKEITDQVNVFFQPYCEALYMWQGWWVSLPYQELPEEIVTTLTYIEEEAGTGWSRQELIISIDRLILEKGSFRWDDLPVLRDALLKIAGIPLETYLLASKKKKYRSIDDP